MKTKLIAITLISSLLAGCDQPVSFLAGFLSVIAVNAHKDYQQRKVVSYALSELVSLKRSTADYYYDNGTCAEDIIDKSGVNKKPLGMIDHISISDSPNGCQLKATFIDSSEIPALSKESIILTMTDGSKTNQGNMFYWQCAFTGKKKQVMPKACQ